MDDSVTRTNSKILIVEDDDSIRYLCETLLQKEGCLVTLTDNIAEARTALQEISFDLVILDLNLPDGDGLSLAQEFGDSLSLPFLIMTIRGTPQERYQGFEAGAADYLIKPFHPGELIHRVRNLLQPSRSSQSEYVRFGDWVLDLTHRKLQGKTGNPINLTRGEFDLLAELVNAKGRIIDRDSLLRTVSRNTSDGHPRTVDVLVYRLRKKIETDPSSPNHILTVPGLGYRIGTSPDQC